MEGFLHQVLAGLATGGIYASVALALVMIYQATHLLNFAQGEMAMFSTYIAWSLIDAGAPYWAAFFATIAISFGMGVLIQRYVLRPVRGQSVLSLVAVFIGLLFIFNSLAGWIFSYTIKVFPSPFPSAPPFGQHYVSSHELGSIGVTLEPGGRAMFGYVLAKKMWRHGFAAEALKHLVDWSLAQPGIFRAWAFCDVENPASVRVMEKAGMVREGLLHRWHIAPTLGPEPRDCVVCARVK